MERPDPIIRQMLAELPDNGRRWVRFRRWNIANGFPISFLLLAVWLAVLARCVL
jgi:hypothetical protein